ncbi:glycosyltransferase family 4 protein [Planktosalinus lacus]|uniref:Glycosyl transferase n=1 Tax=Planktosalinus lacus TaxID=1526573 RepID=A0A8J2VB53_9FLAO|nr:glycosyltransferase family 4 protein [Planktosalinus lacus]GGE00560.1 glycosyl transferase [Planktosalinus lacus]
MLKPKLIRITTVPLSLNVLIKGQLRFMKAHFEVLAVSSGPEEELKEVERREGVSTVQVKMTRSITTLQDLKAVWQLYRLFKKEKPHIVHTHTPKAGTVGMLAAKLAGVPHRLHTVAGLPLLEATGAKRKLLDTVEKFTYSCATKVYPNSKGLYDIILQQAYCKATKLKVIAKGSSNGIDTTHFNTEQISNNQKEVLRSQLNIQPNDFVYVFVGRLVGDKGINELVKAFTRQTGGDSKESHSEPQQSWGEGISPRTTKLLLVGPFESELDPLQPQTLHQIQNNPNILTVGFQKDVRPYLAISHALAFPSYREGFPNVVMQAGAMGLPAIVTDINGCNEIIEVGKNGLVIPVKDTDVLFEKMQQLQTDNKLYTQLQQNARPMICERYEQRVVWEAILEEYRTLGGEDQ